MKILMVCLGNICRSPMAEGILRDKIKARGLDWKVGSCGTSAYHIGEAPDGRAQEMMRLREHDISDLRAEKLTTQMLADYDKIYCMDSSNYDEVMAIATDNQKKKISLMLSLLEDGEYDEVPDPYFNNKFHLVYDLLDKATEEIFNQKV